MAKEKIAFFELFCGTRLFYFVWMYANEFQMRANKKNLTASCSQQERLDILTPKKISGSPWTLSTRCPSEPRRVVFQRWDVSKSTPGHHWRQLATLLSYKITQNVILGNNWPLLFGLNLDNVRAASLTLLDLLYFS